MPRETKASLGRAVARLVDELGATVLIDVEERDELSNRERIKSRFRALNSTQWVWPDHEGPARMLVIYDFAMGPERGTWTTASAKMLRRALTSGGVDIAQCAFACLWDTDADSMKVTAADIHEAATRVRAVVRAADTDQVLVLGGNAGQAWNPTGDLTRLWGGTYLWPGMSQVFVRPVMLPGAVFRKLLTERDWREQIHGFIQEADDNLGLANLGKRCAMCTDDVSVYDPAGVPACRAHADMVVPGVLNKQPRWKQRETLDLGLSRDASADAS